MELTHKMIMVSKIYLNRYSKIYLIILILLISYWPVLFTQVTGIEIQRSSEKVIIGGKVYYIHIVKKHETLYSIAKAYTVTVSDITSTNPDAVNGIKVDQVLRIPAAAMQKEELVVKKNDEQIIHIVAAGQTLYSISRIYGIAVSDIERLNPEVKIDSLQVNQVLKIPVETKKALSQNQENLKPGFIIYKVKEKETIYSLSKHFGLSPDTLLKYNGSLAKEGLKTGQNLVIRLNPSNTSLIEKPDSSINVKKPDSSLHIIKEELLPLLSTFNCDSLPTPVNEKTLNISLLLPLFTSGTYSSEAESGEDGHSDEKTLVKQPDEFLPLSVNFIEFYQGVLLALENMKNQGIQVNLYVFDTEKGTTKIEEILKDQNFQKCKLIIGPVFNDQMIIVSDYAGKNGINVVAPVTCSNELLKGNPSLFSINPGTKNEITADINILKPDTSINSMIIYRADSFSNELYPEFKQALAKKFDKDTIYIKTINVYNNDFTGVRAAIDSLHENMVISPVEDEIFVTNMLGSLESKLVDNKISIIGMREWVNYSGIDLNYFYDLQMTYNSPFYMDYNRNEVIAFLKTYRLFFGTEPVKDSKHGYNYAMLGYDIASYFANAYYTYGNEFSKYVPCIKNKALIAPLKFMRVSAAGGYINNNMQLVKYNKDYTQQVDNETKK
jgi:LysM repeat protein